MKFVKRISLFFIYPMVMFGIGFAANMAIMEYFYPGKEMEVQENKAPAKENISLQVSVQEEPVMHADTRYIVQSYNTKTGESSEQEETPPDKYMGLTRERLMEEIESYNQNPLLEDMEMGFSHMELISFSSERVKVRKSYEPVEEKGFFLLNEDHRVVVYDHSLEHVYMTTNIWVDELPEKLQEEILHMKYIETEGELYNFLESYSS
jgi:hypothetical protein